MVSRAMPLDSSCPAHRRAEAVLTARHRSAVGRAGGVVGVGATGQGVAQDGQLLPAAQRRGRREAGRARWRPGRTGRARPAPPGATASYQSVRSQVPEVASSPSKSRAGRGVGQDVRLVLAADQIDVVDAEVDGRHLVPRRPPPSGPLDGERRPAAQSVGSLEQGPPVGEGRAQLGGEPARCGDRSRGGPRPHGRHGADRGRRPGRPGIGEGQRAEGGAELGDRGPVIGHGVDRRTVPVLTSFAALAWPGRALSVTRAAGAMDSGSSSSRTS